MESVEPVVLVALISAVVAILTAIATIISNLLITKKTFQANRDIEVLKGIKDRVHILFDLSTKEVDKISGLISGASECIQKIRDSARALLNDPDIISERDIYSINNDCRELSEYYQNHHPEINSEDRAFLHEAKNCATQISMSFRAIDLDRNNVSDHIKDINLQLKRIEMIQKELLTNNDTRINSIHNWEDAWPRYKKALREAQKTLEMNELG
jgi:hypothetical protein